MSRLFVGFGYGALLSVAALSVSAQETMRPYDGIQAGLDAYRLGEERRRSDFQQQLNVNEDLRAWAAWRSWPSDTMWYGNAVWPAYGGYGPPYGYSPYGYAAWPYGPGRFTSSSYATPYRQPVGRWEGQTGPNRWESHPVYDPPLVPYQASPPVDSPWLDRTPYAVPRRRTHDWTDGQPGVPDTEYPPAAAPPADVKGELLPPPPTADDEFDMPRRSRKADEPLIPEPPPRRRIREF